MPEELFFTPRPKPWTKSGPILAAQFSVSATAASSIFVKTRKTLQIPQPAKPRIPGGLSVAILSRTAFVFPFSWASLILAKTGANILSRRREDAHSATGIPLVGKCLGIGSLVGMSTALSSLMFHPLRVITSRDAQSLYGRFVTTIIGVPGVGDVNIGEGVVRRVQGAPSSIRFLYDRDLQQSRMRGIFRTVYLQWLPEKYRREGLSGLYARAVPMATSTGFFWGSSIAFYIAIRDILNAGREITKYESLQSAVTNNFYRYTIGLSAGLISHVALQRPLERLVGRKVRGSMVSAITSNRGLTSAHAVGLLAAVLGNERIDRLFE